MFRPAGLLAIQVAPTTRYPGTLGSHGFYVRAVHESSPSRASDMLAVRIGQLTAGDFHPIRFAALSAAPITPKLSGPKSACRASRKLKFACAFRVRWSAVLGFAFGFAFVFRYCRVLAYFAFFRFLSSSVFTSYLSSVVRLSFLVSSARVRYPARPCSWRCYALFASTFCLSFFLPLSVSF